MLSRGHGPSKKASSAGDFDLRGRLATKDDGLGASAQITQPQTGFWLFRDRVAAAICGFLTLALLAKLESLRCRERRRESRLRKLHPSEKIKCLLDFRHDGFVREFEREEASGEEI